MISETCRTYRGCYAKRLTPTPSKPAIFLLPLQQHLLLLWDCKVLGPLGPSGPLGLALKLWGMLDFGLEEESLTLSPQLQTLTQNTLGLGPLEIRV